MRSHQSYPNITTVIHTEVVTSIVLVMSIIVPSRHTGIGAWVNSNLYTSILYNFINFHASVLYKHTEYTGSLGYNSVCCITSRLLQMRNLLQHLGILLSAVRINCVLFVSLLFNTGTKQRSSLLLDHDYYAYCNLVVINIY